MPNATAAFDHLSRYGLDELLQMETASLWRGARSPTVMDGDAYERSFDLRPLAADILGVEEHDRMLISDPA